MKQIISNPNILNGVSITINYEIDRFIKEVLIGGEYKECLEKVNLKDDLIMMDLGCNIGTFSLSIYDRCKQIYAIDLSKQCIELFNQTIKDNQLNKIQTFQQGIAGTNGKVRISKTKEETDGGLSIVNGDGDEIDVITLATFFKQQNIDYIDLLKIDVERAEDEIFQARDFGEIVNKIKVIIGECHNTEKLEPLDKNGFKFKLKPNRHFVAINTNLIYDNDRPSDS